MAELNFGLLTPPGSQSVGNAFVSGMDQAQQARLQEQHLQQSMQQNELAKAKIGEYQRGVAEQNALRNRMTQPGFDINNPQHQQEILGIAPVLGQAVLQHAATMQKTGAEIKRLGAQTEASDAARSKDRQQFNDQALRNLAVNPSDDNIRAWGQDAVINKIYSADKAAEVIDRYLSIPLDQRAATFKQAGAAAPTPQQPRLPDLTKDLLIPDPKNPGKLIPNTSLIGVKKDLARAGASNVNVKLPPIEGEYGKTFAKGIGEDDLKLRGAAISAKDLAANANQTLALLENPQIFTGGAANIKLGIARALNVIGDTDAAAIANTEQLIRGTGKATLAAIKNSGLGTGQGFTDKDLKMLQGVEGGTIDLNADTLRAFATAQHNAAAAIVKQWETRRKGIPAAALSGTGIDKETYTIEPKFSVYVETKTTPDGRRLGKKADGTVEVIK